MAKTLLDFVPSAFADLNDDQLVYLVDPALGRSGDKVVSLGTLKAFLTGVDVPPPPPPPGTVATPTFSPAAGSYTGLTSVSILDDTAGASIFYTLDGSTPTTSSTPYTGSISLSVTTTVKAIAVKSGMTNSAIGSATYTISSGSGGTTGGSNPTGFINIYGADRAEYPRAYISSRMPVRTGALITVAAGGDVQAALNAAQPGDWVVLEAGATFIGNFTIPLKSGDALSGGDNVIVVTTSAFASLPEKVRVTNVTNAAFFATLKTTNTSNVDLMNTAASTQGWRLVGINFAVDATVTALSRMLAIGTLDGTQSTTALAPKNIIVDRCKFNGHSTLNLRRAIGLDGIHCAVINCWFGDEIHHNGQDAQNILSVNTPGPLKIVNNRLSGATEVVMFGGAQATCGMPSDIEVRYNYVTRPIGWRGVAPWTVKNIFETKKARRLLVEGNIFENNWQAGQSGYIMLIKHVPYGDEALGQTEDIIIKHNIIRNAAGGINITSADDELGDPQLLTIHRVVDFHNLYYDIANAANTNDIAYISQLNSNNCIHSHCTFVGDGSAVSGVTFAGSPSANIFKDCIFAASQYPVKGDSTSQGNNTLAAYNVGGVFSKNVVASVPDPSVYPSDCYFPANNAGIGFTDIAADSYALTSASLYKNQASDGTDPGADIAAVNAKTAFAISGDTTTVQT
jgi:hypothetical protein